MLQPDRFDIVVPLHEISGWRRALAVDRGGVAPRAVVISYPPPAITDDPTRLVGLMRDAEAAALVHHPNAVPALGLETAGDLLVAVEAYRRGVSLRALLRVARRLPPELAARVAVDACAALAAVHAVDPGDGHALVHGGISADRLLVADDGATLLCGTGTAGGGAQADDLKAIGAVLRECLIGDPSAPAAEHAGSPEIPAQLLEVVRRAMGDAPDAYADAEALAAAVREAVRPAPPEAMAAYLEAILPAGEGERGELLRLVAGALSRASGFAPPPREPGVPPAQPAAVAASAAIPSDAASPGQVASGPAAAPAEPLRGADPVPAVAAVEGAALRGGTPPAAACTSVNTAPAPAEASPAAPLRSTPQGAPTTPVMTQEPVSAAPAVAPVPAAPAPAASAAAPGPGAPASTGRSRLVLAVAVTMAIVGFGGGLLVARRGRAPVPAPAPSATSPAKAGESVAAAPPPSAAAPDAQPVPPAAGGAATAPAAREPRPPPPPQPSQAGAGTAPSVAVTADPPGEVYVDGKRVGRSPLTVPVSRGEHEVRLRSTYEGVDVRRRISVKRAATPVRFALRRGSLKVTAPQDAEVFVDGKHVGRGDVNVGLWEGTHVVEARLGQARVHEKFTLGPGETWTYDVTPTP